MRTLIIILAIFAGIGCGNGATTYSLLADQQIFRQDAGTHDTKIDMLFMIDNSGSMATSQNHLATEFPVFISQFLSKGFDFKLAVSTSDAYLANSLWAPNYAAWQGTYFENRPQAEKAWFRDGIPSARNGLPILFPNTLDIHQHFMENVRQGTSGRGDERSLQSMRTALESSGNAGFRRNGSFLAVVILTDEDDFSHDGTAFYERYDAPGLHPVSDYVTFLEGFTNTSGATKLFTVNTIAVPYDAADASVASNCITQLGNTGQRAGRRVSELATATNGVKGSICGNFAEELDKISKSIITLATQFYLKGNPIPSTIKVKVNGATVPNAATNPLSDGGWTYNAAANSVMFVGSESYTPPQGSMIEVSFDPASIDF